MTFRRLIVGSAASTALFAAGVGAGACWVAHHPQTLFGRCALLAYEIAVVENPLMRPVRATADATVALAGKPAAADDEPFVRPDDPVEVAAEPTPVGVVEFPAPAVVIEEVPPAVRSIDLDDAIDAALAARTPAASYPRVMPPCEDDAPPARPVSEVSAGVEACAPWSVQAQLFSFWMGLLGSPSGVPAGPDGGADPAEGPADASPYRHPPCCPHSGKCPPESAAAPARKGFAWRSLKPWIVNHPPHGADKTPAANPHKVDTTEVRPGDVDWPRTAGPY